MAIMIPTGRGGSSFPFRVVSQNARFASLFLQLLPLIAVTSALVPTTSVGYALENKTWPNASVITFQVQLGSLAWQLQDGSSSWAAAAAPVFSMWNGAIQAVRLSTAATSTAISSGDGVNSIVFSPTIFGQAFGSGTLAVTYYSTVGNAMVEADVLFNTAQHFDSYRGPLQFGSNGYAIPDIRRVLLHELGHALGLGHPDTAGQHVDAVMNSRISDRETLSNDDISGAQSLYGGSGSEAFAQTDLNSDGKPDVLLQNTATGQHAVWLMNGTSCTGGIYLPTSSPLWNMVATGDFNADGNTDIILQYGSALAVWFMNGLTYQSAVYLPSLPPQWNVASAADFNGDGKPDLLLQNSSTGQRAVWFMNGTAYSGGAYLPTLSPLSKIVGTGDLDGDGKSDIIFQNNSALAAWLMNGVTYKSAVYFPSLPAQWNVAGAADFNGDGKPDFVLQNSSTGQRGVWLMNGASRIGAAYLPTASLQWDINNH